MRARPAEPDPAATNALQEGLGGQFDAMRTSHVEFIGTTISRLLDGSSGYNGKEADPVDSRARSGEPLQITLNASNIHHYLVGRPGAGIVVGVTGDDMWPGTILGSHGHAHTRAINSCQRRARRETTVESYWVPANDSVRTPSRSTTSRECLLAPYTCTILCRSKVIAAQCVNNHGGVYQ
jgi:hypothetical protein